MKATNLKVDYLTSPIGIDLVRPRFSWNFIDGTKQTAYRIIAKDDDGNLLWDSQKVNRNQMHLIKWGADDLKSRTCVTWTVTTWDENDNPETSEEAYFEIGLLNQSDWLAKWITGDYVPKKKERYPVDCFKNLFMLKINLLKKHVLI